MKYDKLNQLLHDNNYKKYSNLNYNSDINLIKEYNELMLYIDYNNNYQDFLKEKNEFITDLNKKYGTEKINNLIVEFTKFHLYHRLLNHNSTDIINKIEFEKSKNDILDINDYLTLSVFVLNNLEYKGTIIYYRD